MLRPYVYMHQWGKLLHTSFLFLPFSISPVLISPITTPTMVIAFDLFSTVFFAPCLKIYDLDDRRIMRTTSNDSEGTGLIYRSRSKVTIELILNRFTDTTSKPISGKRTVNFNLNVGDRLLKFIWFFTTSGVLTTARFWSMTSTMTPLTIMRVIVTPSELYIYPMLVTGFLIKHIF